MINIAEKLKNVPIGTKLYSPICGECYLDKINNKEVFVSYQDDLGVKYCRFTEIGTYQDYVGECLLFPSKENRDWENWKYCEFTEGELVLVRDIDTDPWSIAYFKKLNESAVKYSVTYKQKYGQNFQYCKKFTGQDPYKI